MSYGVRVQFLGQCEQFVVFGRPASGTVPDEMLGRRCFVKTLMIFPGPSEPSSEQLRAAVDLLVKDLADIGPGVESIYPLLTVKRLEKYNRL